MQHQAFLSTPEENLTDVTVSIIDRSGNVIVAAQVATLVDGTSDCYRTVLTVPDSLTSGRERWASVSAGFVFDSDPIQFFIPGNGVAEEVQDAIFLVRDRLNVQAPGDVTDLVVFENSPPATIGLVRVYLHTRDFDEAGASVDFNIAMMQEAPVSLNGIYEVDRKDDSKTVNGQSYVEVYPSSVLAAAGYDDRYIFTAAAVGLIKKIRVPDSDANIADIPAVT